VGPAFNFVFVLILVSPYDSNGPGEPAPSDLFVQHDRLWSPKKPIRNNDDCFLEIFGGAREKARNIFESHTRRAPAVGRAGGFAGDLGAVVLIGGRAANWLFQRATLHPIRGVMVMPLPGANPTAGLRP